MWEPLGLEEHFKNIMERHVYFEENKDRLKPQLEKYRAYKTYSLPPKAEEAEAEG